MEYQTDIVARPLDEWHEDLGNCLWWRFPIQEPPYVGTPHDSDWLLVGDWDEDYYTHFTPIPLPADPDGKGQQERNGHSEAGERIDNPGQANKPSADADSG